MDVPSEIRELTERFERNKDAYRSPQYNETQLRREFLDPFFKALGWDIDNEQGYAEAYKDVIHEDAIKVGEATKAPDYCFRIGGARKFFLEAKKPAVDIKHDVSTVGEKSSHDQIVNLVEQTLELHQRLSAAKTPREKTSLERQITATDTQIDRLVYDLYGLTEDEIKIVEGTI